MYKSVIAGILFAGMILACFPVRAEGCDDDQVLLVDLCWSKTRKSVHFEEAKEICEDNDTRLPTEKEALKLFEEFKDREKELGKILGIKGIPLFWLEQEPVENKVKVALPRVGSSMTMSAESKLYAQCVREP